MKALLVSAIALAATTAAIPAAAESPDAPIYSLRFRVQGIETPGGQPRLTARAGEPATVMIGNDSYTLRIVATPDAGRVAVASQVSYWTPQGLRYDEARADLAADGESGSFAFPATDPRTGATRDVRIEFSAVPIAD